MQASAPAPAPRAKVASAHVRELLAGMTAERACDRLRDSFHALHEPGHADVVSGTLWVRDCSIESDSTTVKVHFEGDGWRWVDKQSEKAGATFAVHQYARFHVAATLAGEVDLAYVPDRHVVTIWYEIRQPPQIEVQARGNVHVDEQGTWSEIVGSIAGVVSSSPEDTAKQHVAEQGAKSFATQLDRGLTITVDACSGLTRARLGILPAGTLAPPSIGATYDQQLALHAGAALLAGPDRLTSATTWHFKAGGRVHVDLACVRDAARAAGAVAEARPLPELHALASRDLDGEGEIRLEHAGCPVAVIAYTLEPEATLAWKRTPQGGQPLVACGETASR